MLITVLSLCIEQESQETEKAEKHELLQQQLEQASEAIAALTEQLSRVQQETSLLFSVCPLSLIHI